MITQPTSIGTGELALRLLATRGAPSYWVVLVQPAGAIRSIDEITAELHALDESIEVDAIESSGGATGLLHSLPTLANEVLLIGAQSYTEADWVVLDRRRSSLAREGATVFLTTPTSFDVLMRVAPNLASWFGGFVFARDDGRAGVEARRAERLDALRAWARRADDDVILAAVEGRLPRDPEYAEWLTLLGRGDLLDARAPGARGTHGQTTTAAPGSREGSLWRDSQYSDQGVEQEAHQDSTCPDLQSRPELPSPVACAR